MGGAIAIFLFFIFCFIILVEDAYGPWKDRTIFIIFIVFVVAMSGSIIFIDLP